MITHDDSTDNNYHNDNTNNNKNNKSLPLGTDKKKKHQIL